ncbi:pectate lyase [Clostridium sp. YIM B02555]|uniref:right-handed parallel beta-helix repeat-containing protein n=1 Tax=Clostridium sp. YIM B02555 TaxID=2911968 RepID=UPI001EEDCB7A|nr:pectate lyase [Clostridium sp. YIM B02555]
MNKSIKRLCLCFITILLSTVITACTSSSVPAVTSKSYFIATNGSDNNPGTLEKPFASFLKAQEAASSGDTVYILGGTYKDFSINDSDAIYNYVNEISKSGITYKAYSSSDVPVFDFSNMPTTKRVAAFYIKPSAKDVAFQSIKVTGVPVGSQKQSECFRIEGNATFNQVTCSNNQAIGFYFTGHATGACFRCDSYNNIGVKGISIGNIDGFGAHGDGVTFKECRAWNNSDDGYDCISSKGTNTFDSCWAFNMNAGGDSNGFKIGGWGKKAIDFTPPVHTVKNCLSVNNGAHGFYANHQPGQSAIWTNNTAYNNKKGNFNMVECESISNPIDVPGTKEVLHYNLSYKNNTLDEANLPSENNSNNSWNMDASMISADNFQSFDTSQLTKDRGADGALPDISFMKLTNNSKLKGLGCFN